MSDDHPKTPDKRPPLIPFQPHHAEDGEGNWLVSYADMMTLLVGFFVILLSFSKVDQGEMEIVRREIVKEFGGSYQVPFGEVADRIRIAIEKAGLGQQFVIKQTNLGVDISFLGTVFFKTGSADLKQEAKELMPKLVSVVQTESADFDIVIEGHTDDTPVGQGLFVKNNWELSSIRACRVLEAFDKAKTPNQRLTAVGYGDTHPMVPNRDAQGAPIEVNQSQNRRVVIKLIARAKASLVGSDEPTIKPEEATE